MANFEWYRSFVAIYRHGSISAAAQFRYMTQPALSQHLAALEAEIGEPLFVRTPRQMLPTERGRLLYAQIVQAVDRLEKVSGDFRHPSSVPVLRIGGPAEWIHGYMIERLPEHPYLLSFVFGETKPLIQSLKNSEIDLLIATQQVATSGLTFVKLRTETFKLVGNRPLRPARASKDACQREGANVDADMRQQAGTSDDARQQVGTSDDARQRTGASDNARQSAEASEDARQRQGANVDADMRQRLESLDWIAYAPELPIIRRFWFAAFGERCTIRPKITVPDLRVIKSLVLQGYGVSVLPDYLIAEELEQGLLHELLPPPEPVQNDLWLACRTSDRVDPTFTAFVDNLLRSCQ